MEFSLLRIVSLKTNMYRVRVIVRHRIVCRSKKSTVRISNAISGARTYINPTISVDLLTRLGHKVHTKPPGLDKP